MGDMSAISRQEIVVWLRERAKKYDEMADLIQEDFGTIGARLAETVVPSAPASNSSRTTVLTAEELENSVRAKTGRVKDLARRLAATPEHIHSLLVPVSKVYIGERGWLKVQD